MTAGRAIAAGVLLGLLAHPTPSAAQVYKWVDEKGTTHFSDHRPAQGPGTPEVQVVPDMERAPVVRNGPPPPSSDPTPQEEEAYQQGRDDAPEPLQEDIEPDAIVVEEPDAIIVEEALPDPAARLRAGSPLNRPGQPIRQPGGRPRRGR